MARKNPLPQKERDICFRVRAFREMWGVTRAKLAESVGTTADYVANLEYYKAPVKVWFAVAVRDHCGGSIEWLATGFGSPFDPDFQNDPTLEIAPPMSLLSAVWEKSLKHVYRGGRIIASNSRELSEQPLTCGSELDTIPPVNSELQALIDRVRIVVAAPGAKAKLARHLGVPSQRISQWLSGRTKRMPGGEMALRLLRWVQEQEWRKT